MRRINLNSFFDEDDLEESSTPPKSEEHIWFKMENPSFCYYTPFINSKSKLTYYSDPKELVNSLQNESYYDIHTENIVKTYIENTPAEEAQKLPNGTYFHEYGNSNHPERLVPFKIKIENYIDLMDSLQELDESVDQFIANKELYDTSLSAYKLGILLFGPPGTGKTSYLKKLISQRDAIVIFMDGVPNRKFLEKLESSTKNRLKIIVVEEVVSLVENSEDVRSMLDFLDGSRSISNTIYFLSTNYPETIPENIIRNGRIDIFVKVDFPNEDARAKLINLYLKRPATAYEIRMTENMPIVDIRELCFLHKKTNKSFENCVKLVEEKNKMLKRHFGKTRDIRLI